MMENRSGKIILSLTGRDLREIENQLLSMKELDFDVVEWRADFYYHPDAFSLIRRICPEKELLFTVRSREEGGLFQGSDGELEKMLLQASLEGKAELVDLELLGFYGRNREMLETLKKNGTRVILSFHDFHSTPSEERIQELFRSMREAGADIGKIAVMPRRKEDVETLAESALRAGAELGLEIIAISMGELGKKTRTDLSLTGSTMTFGALGTGSAPGQVEAGELARLLKGRISGSGSSSGPSC